MDLHEMAQPGRWAARRHPWELARLAFVRRRFAAMAKRLGRDGGTVLDVGCGDAFVLGRLAADYPSLQFVGVDSEMTDELAPLIAQQAGVANMHLVKNLADAPAAPCQIRAVLLLDVLEHVADERAFLADILGRPAVAPDALVLATTPAFQWLFSSHDQFLRHHRRYSRKALAATLESAGLSVLAGGYLFGSLLPARLAGVALEKCRLSRPGQSTGLTDWRGGRAVSAAIAAVLSADCRILEALSSLGLHLPGLSCFAICQKRQ